MGAETVETLGVSIHSKKKGVQLKYLKNTEMDQIIKQIQKQALWVTVQTYAPNKTQV